VTLRFDSRYDSIGWGEEAHRLQNSALLAYQQDLFAGVDLALMASTGPRFQSRWSTWKDLQGAPPERMALSLRQLFVERWFGRALRVQAGSIPPVKGKVSNSGLEDIGWIDGVRLEAHGPSGFVVEAVGGSLTDIDEPDLFIRRRRADYAELEMGLHPPEGFEAEAAVHLLAGGRYAKAEVGWSKAFANWRAIRARLEGALEVGSLATQAIVGVETDLGTLATGNPTVSDYLQLESHCRWVDPEYGPFGTLAEDFYQFGTECRVRLQGKLDRPGRLGWNLRYIAPVGPGLLPRLDVGVTARLQLRRNAPAARPPRPDDAGESVEPER
jgi:hypothetical protein